MKRKEIQTPQFLTVLGIGIKFNLTYDEAESMLLSNEDCYIRAFRIRESIAEYWDTFPKYKGVKKDG